MLNFRNRTLSAKRFSSFINASSENLQFNYLEGADSGIVTVGLNRPEAKNALNRNLADNLFQAVEAIKK